MILPLYKFKLDRAFMFAGLLLLVTLPMHGRFGNGGAIEGTVRDLNGEALPGARVYCQVSRQENFETVAQTEADERGHFSLASLPVGVVTIKVTEPGAKFFAQQVYLEDQQRIVVEVGLAWGIVTDGRFRINGFVTDRYGKRLKGARISGDYYFLSRSKQTPVGPESWVAPVLTGANGEFNLALRESGQVVLRISCPGFTAAELVTSVRPILGHDSVQGISIILDSEHPSRPLDSLHHRISLRDSKTTTKVLIKPSGPRPQIAYSRPHNLSHSGWYSHAAGRQRARDVHLRPRCDGPFEYDDRSEQQFAGERGDLQRRQQAVDLSGTVVAEVANL